MYQRHIPRTIEFSRSGSYSKMVSIDDVLQIFDTQEAPFRSDKAISFRTLFLIENISFRMKPGL
jgi:hypothetical protein